MKAEFFFKCLFWGVWAFVVGVCAYFIVHNAQWCIGDDAIIMNHTGSGIPFLPGDTILPYSGRFYPFAYLIYDLLLLFSKGYITASAHFEIHMVMFLILSLSFALLFLGGICKSLQPAWKCSIALFGTFAISFRLFPDYLNVFSSIWGSYSLLGVFVLFAWLFHEHRKAIYAVIALLVVNYSQYCLECEFAIPLSMGLGGILFLRKQYGRGIWFYWALAGSGLLFLLLYGTVVLPHIKSAYDGAHGTDVSIISNAFHMFLGNKIIMLAVLVFVVRMVQLTLRKDTVSFFDNLLLSGLAFIFVCFILRLNWTMYYNLGAIIVFPAVVFFFLRYLKSPITLAMLLCLVCLYGHKLPRIINDNQIKRTGTHKSVESLVKGYREGKTLYWYSPDADYDRNIELRNWKENSLRSYIQWMVRDSSFDFEIRSVFSKDDSGIWFDCPENDLVAPDREKPADYGHHFFSSGGINGYLLE